MALPTAGSSRDNNFNLLRALAATAVLVSHSHALTSGHGEAEPLRASLGLSLGTLAVAVFFFVSGFLVTGSLQARGALRPFLRARVLRIFPGLVVCMLLTVFVLGPWATTLDTAAYLAHPRTWFHLLKNTTLLFGVRMPLPGVFEDLPYPVTVNGSLWTLPIEFRLYLGLGLLSLIVARVPDAAAPRVLPAAVAALAAVGVAAFLREPTEANTTALMCAQFFLGATLQCHRDRLRLTPRGAGLAAALLAASTLNATAFAWAFTLLLGYLVLWLAYVPGGALRRFNRVGDCSYGLYLYAFPVQQALVSAWPGLTPAGLSAAALPLTLALALASWRLVEAPALRLKARPTPAPAG